MAGVLRARPWVLACACVLAVAFAAPAALADGTDPAFPGSVLHVSVEGPLVAHGHVKVIATGTNAPQSTPILYGLTVYAIDHKQLPVPCSQSSQIEGTTVADSPPQVAVDLTPVARVEGLSGPFKVSVPFTFGTSGDVLFCAYSLSSANFLLGGADAAWASTQVTTSATGSRAPVASKPPRITRSGNRLRCSRGSWSGRPASYRYRWVVVHKAAVPGRRSSLAVTPNLRRRTVKCSVTARNSAGTATATSRPFKVT